MCWLGNEAKRNENKNTVISKVLSNHCKMNNIKKGESDRTNTDESNSGNFPWLGQARQSFFKHKNWQKHFYLHYQSIDQSINHIFFLSRSLCVSVFFLPPPHAYTTHLLLFGQEKRVWRDYVNIKFNVDVISLEFKWKILKFTAS